MGILLFVLLSFSAFADDGLNNLIIGCTDPGRVHNQVPPSTIKIICEDKRIEWVRTDDGSGTFQNHRTMCTTVVTNKPRVGTGKICEPCGWPGSPYTCTGWKEVCSTVSMTYNTTCDVVVKLKSIQDFCVNAIDKEVAISESILETKDTGRTKNVCGVQEFMNGKPINPPASQKNIDLTH